MVQQVPIVISLMSLAISVLVAHRAWKFNAASTRRTSREGHTHMLFEIDKLLIQYPELWAIYDGSAVCKEKDVSLFAAAKREAFIYQHFNLFHLVYDYYQTIIVRDSADNEHWEAWDMYIHQFVQQSSEARRLFRDSKSQEIYSRGFRNYINRMLDHIDQNSASTLHAGGSQAAQGLHQDNLPAEQAPF